MPSKPPKYSSNRPNISQIQPLNDPIDIILDLPENDNQYDNNGLKQLQNFASTAIQVNVLKQQIQSSQNAIGNIDNGQNRTNTVIEILELTFNKTVNFVDENANEDAARLCLRVKNISSPIITNHLIALDDKDEVIGLQPGPISNDSKKVVANSLGYGLWQRATYERHIYKIFAAAHNLFTGSKKHVYWSPGLVDDDGASHVFSARNLTTAELDEEIANQTRNSLVNLRR